MKTKLTKLPPMHLACSNDQLRDALNYIYINKGIATATDAHIMVRYKMNGYLREDILAHLDGKVIHMETWKAIKHAENIAFIDNELMYRTDHWGMVKIPTKNREEIKKLDWEQVWKKVTERPEEVLEFTSIGLNPKALNTLNSVINFNEMSGLSLFFGKTENKEILVKPIYHDYAMGLIMPVMDCKDFKFDSFKI